MSKTKDSNPFDEQNTQDAAGKPLNKKKKRYNPYGENATATPENMTTGP